jgi:hypothetical protein
LKEEALLERKVKVAMPPSGALVEGFDVPVVESTERWTEVKLEDGTVLRVKAGVLSAIRIPGQFDPEGNPMYALKSNIAMVVADAPEHLKRDYKAKKAN